MPQYKIKRKEYDEQSWVFFVGLSLIISLSYTESSVKFFRLISRMYRWVSSLSWRAAAYLAPTAAAGGRGRYRRRGGACRAAAAHTPSAPCSWTAEWPCSAAGTESEDVCTLVQFILLFSPLRLTKNREGCEYTLIICRYGFSCFSQCGYRSICNLNDEDPDPAKKIALWTCEHLNMLKLRHQYRNKQKILLKSIFFKWSWCKFIERFLKNCNYYRYRFPCILSVIFHFFPPGSGFRRKHECHNLH